jgi:hypothetical protein
MDDPYKQRFKAGWILDREKSNRSKHSYEETDIGDRAKKLFLYEN